MKRIVQFFTLVLASVALMVVVSYAWFINAEFVDPQISGYSESAYFGGGDGTDERPYIIKNPRHLYNLAWLQYLGYFNVPIDSTTGHCTSTDSDYFGYNKDYSDYQYSSSTMTQYSFVIIADIDMTGWVLPPIGTNEQPFVGKLVGSANGTGGTVEISNLITTNNFSEFGNKHPGNVTEGSSYVTGTGNAARLNFANVIGFIGAIGKTDTLNTDLSASEAAMANSGVTISSSANALSNIILKATTVKTQTTKALIGAVAGYVNGTIANVGVRRPTLNVLSSQSLSGDTNVNVNISDYTVAGYATNDYTTAKTKRATTIFNPTYSYDRFNFTGMGTADEWGGSMNFADMYTRFRTAKTSTYNNTNGQGKHFDYVYKEIIRSDGSVKQAKQDSGNNDMTPYNNTYYYTRRYQETSNPENGVYLTWARTSNSSEPNDSDTSGNNYARYNYVIGLYKDVYTITRNGSAITGYKIHDGKGHYLSLNATDSATNTITNSNETDASIWIYEGNKLYTYNENVYSTSIIRYLYSTTSIQSSTASSNGTNWTWNDTYNTFYYDYSNVRYYLKCINGTWTVDPVYIIGDGSGNYLSVNDSTISNTTIKDDATVFVYSTITNRTYPSGTIRVLNTNNMNTNYYLGNNNGTLVSSTTQTQWTNNNGKLYVNDTNLYLEFDNGSWKLLRPQYYIKSGSYYLSLNSTHDGFVNQTTQANATAWDFSDYSNTNPQGIVSTTIGNTTYYIRLNNNSLELTTTQNDASSMSINSYGLLSSGNYSILYDNGWKSVRVGSAYYISSGSNYLSTDGSSISNQSQGNATKWIFSNPGTNPSGTIKTIINGQDKYLTSGNGSISIGTSRSYTNESNKLYYYSDRYYYIRYSNSWTGERARNLNNATTLTFTQVYYDIDSNNMDTVSFTALSFTATDIDSVNTEEKIIQIQRENVDAYKLQSSLSSHKPSVSSYVPLNTSKDSNNNITFNVDNKNTGYIIGGSNESSGQKADYRVSEYALSNINSSYASKAWKANSILTVGASGYGTTKYIGSTSYPESNFTKYTNSKDILKGVLDGNSSNVYGLHFMDASISINNIIVAPKVVINNKPYTNYEMPEDCIDFRLASNGIINFFAGCYYTNNNSFFSLHEIIRDTDEDSPTFNKILYINHITKIYKANSTYGNGWKSADCIYQYEGGTWSGANVSNDSRYDLVFDSTWIENPESLGTDLYDYFSNYLFYFEIPVNKGEFALGSVVGGTGAYLIYLDIGANAAPVDRTEIQQKYETVSSDYKFATGIQIIADDQSISTYTDIASNSAVVRIPAGNSISSLVITRTSDTITVTGATLDSSYCGENITLSGATLKALVERTTTRQVLKYIDYNLSRDKLYHSTVTKTDVDTVYNNILSKTSGTNSHPNATYNYIVEEISLTDGSKTTIVQDVDKTLVDESYDYGLLQITTNTSNTRVGTKVNASDLSSVITTPGNSSILSYKFFTTTISTNDPFRGITENIDMDVARITTQKNIPNASDPSHPYQVNNSGELTITDTLNNEYVLSYVYELTGNTISITLANGTIETVNGTPQGSTYIIQDGLITVLVKENGYSFTIINGNSSTNVTTASQTIQLSQQSA